MELKEIKNRPDYQGGFFVSNPLVSVIFYPCDGCFFKETEEEG